MQSNQSVLTDFRCEPGNKFPGGVMLQVQALRSANHIDSLWLGLVRLMLMCSIIKQNRYRSLLPVLKFFQIQTHKLERSKQFSGLYILWEFPQLVATCTDRRI